MRHLFNSPLGADIAPSGHFKCIAAAAIAGIASGAGVLGSGLASLFSQADTNRTNKQIAEEQMQFAKEQYEREKEENRYLIDSQRKYDREVALYNSPGEERKRLEAAGINPSLAKYGQSGMMQASQTGVGNPAQFKMPEPYHAQGLDFSQVGQSLGAGLNAYYDAEMAESQVEAIRQKTRNDYVDLLDKLENSKIDRETKRFMQRDVSRRWTFENETWDARKEAISLANESVRANTRKLKAETRYQDMINDFEPKQQQMLLDTHRESIKEIKAKCRLHYATADAQDAVRAYNIALKNLSEEQKRGVKMDNDSKEAMADAIVDAAFSEADMKYWQAEGSRVDAGSTSIGISKRGISERVGSSNANDPDYRRVRHDSRGRMYIWDNKENKRIYIDSSK